MSTAWNSTIKRKQKHKYKAKRIFRNDRTWDSTGEWRRYCELQLLERGGEISNLHCQPVFKLTKAQISYRADFTYMENAKRVVEDFKGVRTPRFNMICKLWRYYGPCLLRITGKRGKRYGIVTQEIMPEVFDEEKNI